MSPKTPKQSPKFQHKIISFPTVIFMLVELVGKQNKLNPRQGFSGPFYSWQKKAYRKDFIKTALLYKAVSFCKVTATIAEQVRRDENILSCKHSTDFLICNGTKRSPQTTIKEKASFYATVTSKSFYVQCG